MRWNLLIFFLFPFFFPTVCTRGRQSTAQEFIQTWKWCVFASFPFLSDSCIHFLGRFLGLVLAATAAAARHLKPMILFFTPSPVNGLCFLYSRHYYIIHTSIGSLFGYCMRCVYCTLAMEMQARTHKRSITIYPGQLLRLQQQQQQRLLLAQQFEKKYTFPMLTFMRPLAAIAFSPQ